uniref:Tetraspanin n=1 Tax=Cyprinus carpio TaxID=7962 RepID=A0A8C1T9E7_CYPCA
MMTESALIQHTKFLGGGATAGYGIWSQINQKTSEVLKTVDGTTLTTVLSMGSPMLIALGCIFALMGLIGFCGTLKKISWMLLFFVVVLIIFILQVIAAVNVPLANQPSFSGQQKENALSSLEVKFVESLRTKYDQDQSFTNIWNGTMTKLNCCGYKGYDDFTNSTFLKGSSEYPKQCCKSVKNFNPVFQIVAMFVSLKVYRCLRSLPDLPDPFSNNL